MAIEYPKWKTRGVPTPNDLLVICPKCQRAEWVCHGMTIHCYTPGCNSRMRKATKKETEQGKKALKTIL